MTTDEWDYEYTCGANDRRRATLPIAAEFLLMPMYLTMEILILAAALVFAFVDIRICLLLLVTGVLMVVGWYLAARKIARVFFAPGAVHRTRFRDDELATQNAKATWQLSYRRLRSVRFRGGLALLRLDSVNMVVLPREVFPDDAAARVERAGG